MIKTYLLTLKKSKNLELLENLKKWFKFKFEVIFFIMFMVLGRLKMDQMATVIGIFENQYLNKKTVNCS